MTQEQDPEKERVANNYSGFLKLGAQPQKLYGILHFQGTEITPNTRFRMTIDI